MTCRHCGYPINPGAANHPDCVAKHADTLAARIADLDAEVSRLRRVVVAYGDRLRMSNAEAGLQQTIDRAFAEART